MFWAMNLLDEAMYLLMPGACMVCERTALSSAWRVICPWCVDALPTAVGRVIGPPSIIETWALGPHEGPLGVLVREAKYGRNLALIDRLGARLGVALAGHIDVDAIVPIPIPWRRRWLRGFDQGDRIGRAIAAETGTPFVPLLARRDGPTQVGKTASQRRLLPISAISVRRGVLPSRVLLVDDVRTTGSTLHAAARALIRRGVSQIWAATLSHQDG